jgi:hypothetical protein
LGRDTEFIVELDSEFVAARYLNRSIQVEFAADSPLEQAGFELPVPLATVSPVKRRNVAGGPFSAAMMTETEKLRTERLVAQPWQIEGLPLGRIGKSASPSRPRQCSAIG